MLDHPFGSWRPIASLARKGGYCNVVLFHVPPEQFLYWRGGKTTPVLVGRGIGALATTVGPAILGSRLLF